MPATPTDLRLEDIHPSLGAMFSPNLHAFLRRRRNAMMLAFGRVFRDAYGALWLGYQNDSGFHGAKLDSILARGELATTAGYSRSKRDLVEVEGFWESYMERGRCAIDPEHRRPLPGDGSRFEASGKTPHCLWCAQAKETMRAYASCPAQELS